MTDKLSDQASNPFTPGAPVPVELFVGRTDQIAELSQCAAEAASGKVQTAFVLGDRGMGKSSLTHYLRSLASRRCNLLAVHVLLGGVRDLTEMVRRVIDEIFNQCADQRWFERLRSVFGGFVQEIGAFGIRLRFAPPQDSLEHLTAKFAEVLDGVAQRIEGETRGLLIALDDIDALAQAGELADWYKSFVDSAATHFDKFPVLFMLVGLPEVRDALSMQQPSLMRIFRNVKIDRLSDNEVREFFDKTFAQVQTRVEPGAAEVMVRYSSGVPTLMQEVGQAVFRVDRDRSVSEKDALLGVVGAAESVGQGYLEPAVYRAIRSPRYRSILRKLGRRMSQSFTKREIESRLTPTERRVFHNFLRRMRDLGIIQPDREKPRGAYCFANQIYPVYIWMESLRAAEEDRSRGGRRGPEAGHAVGF